MFEESRRRIRNTSDRFDQSDGAKDTFDLWYNEARDFAKSEERDEKRMARITLSAMSTLLDTTNMISADSFAVRSITEEFGKLLRILRTKPKFTRLVSHLQDYLFSDTLRKFVKVLSQSQCSKDTRVCVAKNMNELMWLRNSFDDSSAALSQDHIVRLVKIVSDLKGNTIVDDSSLLRDELLHILSSVAFRAKGPEEEEEYKNNVLLDGHAEKVDDVVRECVALGAVDVATFKILWNMGVLQDSKNVRVLTNRASRDVAVARALIDSLRESIVDMSSEDEDEVVKNIERVADAIVDLSEVCDITLMGNQEKRSECILRFMESLLDIIVTSSSTSYDLVNRFVSFLLRPTRDTNNVPDLDSLKLLTRVAPNLSERLFVTTILPYLSRAMERGVSSDSNIARFSETEQELVNLLRECVRCFFTTISVNTSEELGRLCFDSMVSAMKRGYGETERFSDLIALVMSRHKSSLVWLQEVLATDRISGNDKSAAVLTICRRIILFGTNQSSIDGDETTLCDDDLARETLRHLADVRGEVSNELWIDLLTRHPNVVRKVPDALSRLLHGLQDEVNEKKCTYLKSSEELLDVISSCGIAVSGNAVALLRAIVSRLDDGEDEDESTESLQNALRGVRNNIENNKELMSYAMRLSSHRSIGVRCEVARLVPTLMLSDKSIQVRLAAIRSIKSSSPLKLRVSRDTARRIVLYACAHKDQDDDHATSNSLQLHEFDMLSEVSPLFVKVLDTHPSLLGSIVDRLVRAAKVTAENDPQDRPSLDVIRALDHAVQTCSKDRIEQFVRESYGSQLLNAVISRSGPWKRFVKDCLNRGLISNTIVESSKKRVKDVLSSETIWIKELRREEERGVVVQGVAVVEEDDVVVTTKTKDFFSDDALEAEVVRWDSSNNTTTAIVHDAFSSKEEDI